MFIAKKPNRDSCHVEFVTNLHVTCKAPHPCGVCMDRFRGGIFKERTDNFEVVKHCMDIEKCALELRNKDDKILEDERMTPQAHNLVLSYTHPVAQNMLAGGLTWEMVVAIAQELK